MAGWARHAPDQEMRWTTGLQKPPATFSIFTQLAIGNGLDALGRPMIPLSAYCVVRQPKPTKKVQLGPLKASDLWKL
jgi:hypothetical protein